LTVAFELLNAGTSISDERWLWMLNVHIQENRLSSTNKLT
jgi:hypothetical protein